MESGDTAETFELFDFHCHILYGNTTDELHDILVDNGIIGCALSPGYYGDEDENFTALHFDEIINAAKKYPEFFYPFAEVPRDPQYPYPLILEAEITDRMRELDLQQTPLEIKNQLKRETDEGTPLFHGIGEICFEHNAFPVSPLGDFNPPNSDVAKSIYQVTAKYSTTLRPMIINAHVESRYINELNSALEYIKRKDLNIIYIWAHAGATNYEDLNKIDRLMKKYPNLYVDLSTLEPYTKPTLPDLWPVNAEKVGRTWVLKDIKPNWKTLLLKYPDRFLFGLDLAFEERKDNLPNVIAFFNHLLGQLDDRESAEKIANKNAKRLLGIE